MLERGGFLTIVQPTVGDVRGGTLPSPGYTEISLISESIQAMITKYHGLDGL